MKAAAAIESRLRTYCNVPFTHAVCTQEEDAAAAAPKCGMLESGDVEPTLTTSSPEEDTKPRTVRVRLPSRLLMMVIEDDAQCS